MKVASIYAIEHKGQRIYVGSTTKTLKQRLYHHIKAPHSAALRTAGLNETDTTLVLLETVPDNEARPERELFWIEKLRSEGHALVNRHKPFRCESPDGTCVLEGCEEPVQAPSYLYCSPKHQTRNHYLRRKAEGFWESRYAALKREWERSPNGRRSGVPIGKWLAMPTTMR